MRAITVQHPWAWAIVYGGKDVENRSRNIAGGYRGPVAIHAGLRFDDNGGRAWPILRHPDYADAPMIKGAFIGIAALVDVHESWHAEFEYGPVPCCNSEWADTGCHHLVLANARALPQPIPARGKLGLWTPGPDALEQLRAAA